MTVVLALLKQFWPYILAFTIGFSAGGGSAWKVQGLRLTSAQQELAQYKLDQGEVKLKSDRAADTQREKASLDYAHLSGILDEQINNGVVYKRCVAAGRCGVRHDAMPACTGIRLPPALGIIDPGTNPVLVGQGATAGEDQVVNDCAVTTLMLNRLQEDIENQPGFKE